MGETLILLSSIPPFLHHDLLIELCESFGELKHYKRLMNSQGVYLDFMFLTYKDERSVYYLLNTGSTLFETSVKPNENIPKEFIVSLNFVDLKTKNKLKIEDKDIAYKLENVLKKIQWSKSIADGLSLINSGKTLELHMISKIQKLKETIREKLANKNTKPNFAKIKKLLDKFL